MGGLSSFYMCLDNKDLFKGALLFAPAIKSNEFRKPLLKKMGIALGTVAPKAHLIKQPKNCTDVSNNWNSFLNYKKD